MAALTSKIFKPYTRWKKLFRNSKGRESQLYVCMICGRKETVVGPCPPNRVLSIYPITCSDVEDKINYRIHQDKELTLRNTEVRLMSNVCKECNGFGCPHCVT